MYKELNIYCNFIDRSIDNLFSYTYLSNTDLQYISINKSVRQNRRKQ
jgi:hypothetical protein